MIRTDKFSKAVSLEHNSSFNQSKQTDRKLQISRTYLNSILIVALLAIALVGSYTNGKLFFNELATATVIVLLLLIVKSKSQPI